MCARYAVGAVKRPNGAPAAVPARSPEPRHGPGQGAITELGTGATESHAGRVGRTISRPGNSSEPGPRQSDPSSDGSGVMLPRLEKRLVVPIPSPRRGQILAKKLHDIASQGNKSGLVELRLADGDHTIVKIHIS